LATTVLLVAALASLSSGVPAIAGIKLGAPIAKLYVPRFGKTWARVVYEGTSVAKVLTPLGIGHYSSSAFPGQEGNFALAAHRFASGGAFLNIDKLRKGDLAFVVTTNQKFTYRFLQSKIVDPQDTWVIDPMPPGMTAQPLTDHLMTFTTCTPVHVNTHRYIAWFEQIGTEKVPTS
jgi:sortase A